MNFTTGEQMKVILITTSLIALAAGASSGLAQTASTPATMPSAPAAPSVTEAPGVQTPAAQAVPVAPGTVTTPAPHPAAVATEAATPSAPMCELHIWPAARVAASTQGAGMMFGLIGGLIDAAAHADQNKRDTAFITAALDPAAQARALEEMDMPKTLNLPAAKVISHNEGIELTSETTGRLAQSSAPCYYDVVVRQLFYLKTATTKGKMRTFIMVRGSDGGKRVIDYKDSANHALDVKLPKEGEDATPASRALIDAFKADVSEFSEKFVRKTAVKS